MMVNYDRIAESVVKGDQYEVEKITQQAIDEGAKIEKIIYEGLIKGMGVVAEKWKTGELFVPEVLISSRAMKRGMALVSPLIGKEVKTKEVIVLGTVKGDIHDIGKNLVSLMMEAAGFKVVDLGTNVDKEVFVKSIKETNAPLLGLSALLTTTIPYMEEVISEFERLSLRGKVKILVGGAPINQKFADSIGADGYAENAAFAVEKAKELAGI
jgi:5-methyltetrahydrofolate--homocysteine methyltransferase